MIKMTRTKEEHLRLAQQFALSTEEEDESSLFAVHAPSHSRTMKTRIVNRIPEWKYQAEVVARLHKMEDEGLPVACAGDMNAERRGRMSQMIAKLTGMTAGEPDIRIYLSGGRLLLLELKTPDGSRSKAQKARHARLGELGFDVLTVAAATPAELADAIEREVRHRL